MAVVVRLLGEVSTEIDGQRVDLGTPKQRCVLAALAVDAGRVVPVDRLVERVSGTDVAQRSRATLQSYISRLRRALAAGNVNIVRRSGGYALITDTSEPVTDLHQFRDLCSRARDDDGEAVRAWTEALALWQGQPLTGVDGAWAEAERDRLSQERLAAEHDLADALLRLGKGGQLVSELSARSAEQPLDERVAGQYMLALHQAGRTIDALEHYREVRARLVEELGTEPGAALQDLHQQLLNADSALAGAFRNTFAEPVVPRQLPMPPAPFVGRQDELDALNTALDPSATTVVTAIAGSGGVGKTWLALHWAHQHAHRFPDGQLYVDLRGFSPDGDQLHPAVAVRGFLDALGVESGRIPVDPHAQTALFRSLVANKRMLLVLDNAADTTQITPLLPGNSSCTVLVTSRNRLPGLITGHNARHVALDVLDEPAARNLLAARLGTAAVEAEPNAVDELVRLCGGFPLALSIIAGRVHTYSRSSLPAIAAELRESLLDVLDEGDPVASLPAVLSLSYNALTDEQATVFGLLSIAPGPNIALPAAASLTALTPTRTRTVLRGLEQASLITQDASGRYGMHDLIRRYAASQPLPPDARETALRRAIDFYLHTAHAADRLLHLHRVDIDLTPPTAPPHPLPDAAAAMDWLQTEHLCLLAAQQTAATQQWHRPVWQLAWSLSTYHQLRGHHRDQINTWQTALPAAEHLPAPPVLVLAHRQLGLVHAELGHHEQAMTHLQQALSLAEHQGDETAQTHTHTVLARAYEQQGNHQQALQHSLRSLSLSRSLDNPVWEAGALNGVGWFYARLGNHERAREHCLAALALYRAHHNPSGEAGTLDSLGYIAHLAGHHEEAVKHYRESLALQRELIYDYAIAEALAGLGAPHAALGQHAEARAAWQEALEIYQQQGRTEEAQRIQAQLDALD
ncbi:BTAD domain-containing putative transcriptional regulator [Lentzea sp. NPDC054927]